MSTGVELLQGYFGEPVTATRSTSTSIFTYDTVPKWDVVPNFSDTRYTKNTTYSKSQKDMKNRRYEWVTPAIRQYEIRQMPEFYAAIKGDPNRPHTFYEDSFKSPLVRFLFTNFFLKIFG